MFTLRTAFGTPLGVDAGRLVHGDPAAPVLAYRPPSAPDLLFLAAPAGDLDTEGEAGPLPLLSYRVLPQGDGFALRHPTTGRLLGAEPAEAGPGRVVCTREAVGAWEVFTAGAAAEPGDGPLATLIRLEAEGGVQAPGHVETLIAADPAEAVALLAALLRLRSDAEIRRLAPRLGAMPGYARLFPFLRLHLNNHAPAWSAYTRLALAATIARRGWEIGDHTYGVPTVLEEEYGHLRIGRYCSIAAGVSIVLANHRTDGATTYPFTSLRALWPGAQAEQTDHEAGSVDIGNDVWIGLNATILPGTLIGDGCIVGAGAVVRGRIPPYSVVAGNPGRAVKPRFDRETVARLLRLRWWDLPDDQVDRLIPRLLDHDLPGFLDAAEAARAVAGPVTARLQGSLEPCTGLWGACEIVAADPETTRAEDLLYLPFRPGAAWGIFGRDGHALPASVDHHGPDRSTAGQILQTDPAGFAAAGEPPSGDLIYGGTINPHYGHFLVNTLPRLWLLARETLGRRKILCHAASDPAHWFTLPFMAEIFAQLGLGPEDFLRFDRPVRLHALLVPAPSFEEQNVAHRVFGELAGRIGAGLLAGEPPPREDRPAYLSKTAMTSGVGRFVNEDELVRVLRRSGFDIVHPERLSLRAQVRLFAARRVIVGSTGSAFHTSLFVRERRTLIGLNPISNVNSNHALIDRLGPHDSRYYHPTGTELLRRAGDTFLTSFRLPNPQRVADEVIGLVEAALAQIPPEDLPASAQATPPPAAVPTRHRRLWRMGRT